MWRSDEEIPLETSLDDGAKSIHDAGAYILAIVLTFKRV